MRDGATHRFSSDDGRITSESGTAGSAIASYTLRVTCGMSRNDIVLLDWGSRSRSSVRLPRRARAAARLIAVVVLPTPPFWLAIATIMMGGKNRATGIVTGSAQASSSTTPQNYIL